MTSKIIVNTIEADTGISSVTFASNISLQNDSSILVSSSGVTLGTGSTIAAPSANEITLSTNSAERLRIDSSGRLLVGHTSSVSSLADVKIEAVSNAGAEIHLARNDSSVTAGNAIGILRFYGNDGGTYQECAAIKAQADGTHADGDKPSRLTFLTTASGSNSSTERLRITSDGKIGIGTDTPDKLLTVSGANTVARFKSSTSYVDLLFQNDTKTNGYIQYNNSGNLNFYADSGSTPTLTIKGGAPGNVGINETNPSHVLDVKSQADATYFINGQNHNGNNIFQVYESSDGDGNHGMIYLNNGSGTTLTKISTNGSSYFNGGNIGINIATPERKLEVVETASSLTIPVAVSNFTNASAGVGAGIAFHLTTGGNNRGELGLVYAGNSNTDGTDFVFRPNDGSTGQVERMRITNAGYVLKSDTPAFKCKLSGATGANFTGFFVFGNVSYNIGSHYNSSNGRFTAPVDGRYLFSWYTNMERAGGNGSFYAEWYINNNAQGNRMYSHHSGAWELIGGTVIFDLNANDYVQIKAITSGNWDGGQYGSYSGYLLG